MSDERLGADGKPTGGRTAAQQLADATRAREQVLYTDEPDDGDPHKQASLLAMSEAEKEAHLEFREAAREARRTQEAAQKAALRYNAAVKRLSEVCAPPTVPE